MEEKLKLVTLFFVLITFFSILIFGFMGVLDKFILIILFSLGFALFFGILDMILNLIRERKWEKEGIDKD